MTVEFESSTIVLSLALAIVGAWLSMILVEQTFFRKRERKSYWPWIGLSGLALAIGAIWTPILVGLTSVRMGLPIEFDPAVVFSSVFIGIGSTCCAYSIMITSVVFERRHAKESADSKNSQQQTASEVAAEVGRTLRRGIDWKLALSAAVLTGGIVAVHFVAFASILVECDVANSAGPIIAGIVLCAVMSAFGLLIFFHLRTSQLRLIGAVCVAGAVMFLHFLTLTGVGFTYSAVNPPSGIAGPTLRLIASVLAAVFSLVLMGINIDRLKLSRNHLDRMVLLMASKYMQVSRELRKEKGKVLEMETWLDLIARSRPERPHHPAIQRHLKAAKNRLEEAEAVDGVTSLSLSYSKSTKVGETGDAIDKARELDLLVPHVFKLQDVLSHPVMTEVLKDQMNKSLSVENVLFLLEVAAYKKCTSKDERKVLGMELFRQFFAFDAPTKLNLSDEEIRPVIKRIEACDFDKGIFDEACTEIMKLINHNDLPKMLAEMKEEARELFLLRSYIRAVHGNQQSTGGTSNSGRKSHGSVTPGNAEDPDAKALLNNMSGTDTRQSSVQRSPRNPVGSVEAVAKRITPAPTAATSRHGSGSRINDVEGPKQRIGFTRIPSHDGSGPPGSVADAKSR